MPFEQQVNEADQSDTGQYWSMTDDKYTKQRPESRHRNRSLVLVPKVSNVFLVHQSGLGGLPVMENDNLTHA